MSSKTANRRRHLIYLGVALATLFWLADAAIDACVFHEATFVGQLFQPGAYELWIRFIVITTILIMTAYAIGYKLRLASACQG